MSKKCSDTSNCAKDARALNGRFAGRVQRPVSLAENPTLTILTLVIRPADYVAEQMSKQALLGPRGPRRHRVPRRLARADEAHPDPPRPPPA